MATYISKFHHWEIYISFVFCPSFMTLCTTSWVIAFTVTLVSVYIKWVSHRAYAAFLAKKKQIKLLHHSPYLPDVVPCGYFLLASIKVVMKAKRFDNILVNIKMLWRSCSTTSLNVVWVKYLANNYLYNVYILLVSE